MNMFLEIQYMDIEFALIFYMIFLHILAELVNIFIFYLRENKLILN